MAFCFTGLCVYSGDCPILLQNFFNNLRYVVNGSPHKVQTSKLGKELPLKKCLYYASICLGIHHI